MSVLTKPGTRLRSTACTTEVVVVAGAADVDLRCGGTSMADAKADSPAAGEPTAPFDGGTQIGKRYVHEGTGLEVLCVRAGAGSLAVGAEPLALKAAKPLPASD
ncbi:hypothetical protein [Cryptosporangium aurantiacum]|uniref:Uncharacterized protein n=1 Tax=Cryptosporangium aurantiacum TaxID=134849 RepID=A0A1M7PLM6_9ACTN|nr:hypothetical protein [Cryptosporangium aurantiacum]SHN18140.1 hypothetical protein SAMN05443668_103477 [Cryptosporangium aurantiacum]